MKVMQISRWVFFGSFWLKVHNTSIIYRRTRVMVWYHLYSDITSPPFISSLISFLFFKKNKSKSFNTKYIMQLHLRCHSHKSGHKFVVQLRHMLLVRVLMATKMCHTQMRWMTRPPREVMKMVLWLSIEWTFKKLTYDPKILEIVLKCTKLQL